jgi:hypothetical protein
VLQDLKLDQFVEVHGFLKVQKRTFWILGALHGGKSTVRLESSRF